MDDLLRGVATYGTAARARQVLKRNDLAGKTGTTNDSVDAWFSGYSPQLVGVAWLGYDPAKSFWAPEKPGAAQRCDLAGLYGQRTESVPGTKARPDARRTDRGRQQFYFTEFPPGQAVTRIGLQGKGLSG